MIATSITYNTIFAVPPQLAVTLLASALIMDIVLLFTVRFFLTLREKNQENGQQSFPLQAFIFMLHA